MAFRDVIRSFIVSDLMGGGAGEPPKDSDLLIEEGIIDSFGIMALLGFLEEKFAIHISGDELLPENFASIESISSLVDRKTELRTEA